MKTLLVLAPDLKRMSRIEQQKSEASDQSPRFLLLEDRLEADVIDDLYLQKIQSRSVFARFLCKLLPLVVVQALVVYRLRRRYDAVVSWDDRFALMYAFFLRFTRARVPHVAILSWVVPPRKAFFLKFVQKGIDRIVLWNQTQCDLLVEFFKISPAKIVVIPYFVDQHFWRPMPGEVGGICAVGDSRRDYATLIEAMRGLHMSCGIATRVQPARGLDGDWGATAHSLAQVAGVPDNIIIEAASLTELRALYARSRFVVVPLFSSFRDSGVTVVTQAMAMGKAIICSRIPGQIEFLEEGINGIFVPPGDPQALREAICYLWEHPEVAARMGAEGRRRAEEIFALEFFTDNVRQIVEDTLSGSRTSIPTMADKIQEIQTSSIPLARRIII